MPAQLPCPPVPGPADLLLPELIEDLLRRGMQVRLGVGGVSMAPRLRDHDHVVVEPLHGKHARFGDLVLFRNSGGTLVLHRVVRRWCDSRGRHRLQTRGDANIRLDPSIDCARVLGRVRRTERKGRGSIDLETMGERLRAVAVGARKLLCSALYYKLRSAAGSVTGAWRGLLGSRTLPERDRAAVSSSTGRPEPGLPVANPSSPPAPRRSVPPAWPRQPVRPPKRPRPDPRVATRVSS